MKMKHAFTFGLVTLGGALLWPGLVHADPSFDCAQASKPDEVAICSDPQLAKLDSLVAAAYGGYQPSFQSKAEVGRLFLADRASCGGDKVCIAAAQLNALETYGGDADWAEKLVADGIAKKAAAAAAETSGFASQVPQQIAQCVKTRISQVTTRFGKPLTPETAADGGIYAAYENGGYVSSYEGGAGFDGAKAGQAVIQCLVSIPRDCPAGDDRGRVYYSLDLATKGSWTAPDSQHSCGGA